MSKKWNMFLFLFKDVITHYKNLWGFLDTTGIDVHDILLLGISDKIIILVVVLF